MALGTTDISVQAVKSALGVPDNGVRELCLSSAINKWSKHKPFHSSAAFHATMAAFEADLAEHKGASPYRVYGLSVKKVSQVGDLSENETPFTYSGPGAPFRLGDFRGYEHSASSPMPYLSLASETTVEVDEDYTTGHYYKGTVRLTCPPNTCDLKLSDFKDTYNGVEFSLADCTLCLWAGQPSSIGTDGSLTDTGLPVSSLYGRSLDVTIGIDYYLLTVNAWVVPVLRYPGANVFFQMAGAQYTKFVQSSVNPQPASLSAWHRQTPDVSFDLTAGDYGRVTIEWSIAVQNTGDVAATTRVYASIDYGVTEEQVDLIPSVSVGAQSTLLRSGTTTHDLTRGSSNDPEVTFRFINANGSWELVDER